MTHEEEVSWAWATALFDAEGTMGLVSKPPQIRLMLGMVDEDIVQRFVEIVGVGNVKWSFPPSRRNRNKQPMYYWSVTARDSVTHVMNHLLPLLGQRRTARYLELQAQATPRMLLCAACRRHRCRFGHLICGRCHASIGWAVA